MHEVKRKRYTALHYKRICLAPAYLRELCRST